MKDKKERNRIAVKKYRENNPGYWKSWSPNLKQYRLLYQAKANAKRKNLPYDLDKDWVDSIWTGRCELTNITFRPSKGWRNMYSPSIDRIVPEKGYTIDNCSFILWGLNTFKELGTDEDMLDIAEMLLNNYKERKLRKK